MIADFPPDQGIDWPPPEVLIERAQMVSAILAYLRGTEHDTWIGTGDAALRRVIRHWLALRWAYRKGRVQS